MNIKFLLSTFILVISIFVMSGCSSLGGNDNPIADDEGNMLKYSINDLHNGFFVKNTDNTFSPVMAGMSNYNEDSGTFLVEEDSAERFIWFCDTETIRFNKITPIISKKTPLIGFFRENSDIPDTIKLEKFEPLGYTLGCTFEMSEDQTTINLKTDKTCANSTAAYFISERGLSGEYEIVKFNEREDVPISNVDPSTGLLLGLEKNRRYQLGYYDGTTYNSSNTENFSLYADTRIFRSTGNTNLEIPFTKSTNGYFKINLPDNLEEGYYYINDYGLFKYEP